MQLKPQGDDDGAAVLARVRTLIHNGDMTQAEVARGSGVSAGVLNPLLKGTYPGNEAAQIAKLRAWLDLMDTRGALRTSLPSETSDFIEIPSAIKLLGAIEYAHVMSSVTMIYGGAGLTKTSSMKEYQRRQPSLVWYVRATVDCNSAMITLEEIAHHIGCNDGSRQPARLRRQIVNRLQGTRGLLMIDEAQHLGDGAVESVRDIHDLAGIGLVMAGNAEVYDRFYGNKIKGDSFAQFGSRVGKRVPLRGPMEGDVPALAAAFGVTGSAELAFLARLAQRKGALRNCVQALRLAGVIAASAEGPITLERLKAAWADLQALDLPASED